MLLSLFLPRPAYGVGDIVGFRCRSTQSTDWCGWKPHLPGGESVYLFLDFTIFLEFTINAEKYG